MMLTASFTIPIRCNTPSFIRFSLCKVLNERKCSKYACETTKLEIHFFSYEIRYTYSVHL